MTMQHVIKLSDVVFNVARIAPDGSVIVDAAGRKGRFIPGKNKLIVTAKNGQIKSLRVTI